MTACLECLVKFDDGFVSEFEEQVDFVHDLVSLLFLRQVLLVNGLNGHKFTGQLMHP